MKYKVLGLEPESCKALYRRALARMASGKLEDALA